MKKMLAFCFFATLGYCSFGQTVTVVNYTNRDIPRIVMNTLDGIGTGAAIPDVFVAANSTLGPLNVSSLYVAQTGNPNIPNLYVDEAENNGGSSCTNWQVSMAVSSWTPGGGCGTPPPVTNVLYSIDASHNVVIEVF